MRYSKHKPGTQLVPMIGLSRHGTSFSYALKRLAYFVDGIAIGSEAFLREQLSRQREIGCYSRRVNPIGHWMEFDRLADLGHAAEDKENLE